MYADLHIHSTFSDSTRTPEDIVHEAKKQQVSLLSVCDHDSIGSYERLAAACSQNNISYILGIELGATLKGESYHVLAYNFDKQNSEMLEFIRHQYTQSQKDCENMIVKMCVDYPQLSLSDYISFEYPKELGGWKYIHYAVERGIFKTYDEAGAYIYLKYMETGEDDYSIEQFCSLVKRANGVPVLAHPGNDSPDKLRSFLRDMQDNGIEGIECFYPSHSKESTEIYVDYCRKNNLRITGGSDCHGEYDKSEGFTIGALHIPVDMLDLRGKV